MPTQKFINIVWLKRDLRLQDHAPLDTAENAGLPYLITYLSEPSILAHPDCALRHQQFVHASIEQMNLGLVNTKQRVWKLYGEAEQVFAFLIMHFQVRNVFSYRESGVQQP